MRFFAGDGCAAAGCDTSSSACAAVCVWSCGHLALDATLAEYEQIIFSAVRNQAAIVYLYAHDDVTYVVVAASIQRLTWLVMFDMGGVLESAYIVERPDLSLRRSVFDRVGVFEEILS